MAVKPKVAIGIAGYGTQAPNWWVPLASVTSQLHKEGVEFDDIYFSGVSNPDVNRNNVVEQWRSAGKSDWLWWIDTDNPPKIGTLERLLSSQLPLVSGLYYSGDPNKPDSLISIAYIVNKLGRYIPYNRLRTWEVGELFQVDAVGMGCFLTHRDVYTEIHDTYKCFNRLTGGLMHVHKDNILGKTGQQKYSTRARMGKVFDGVLYDPVVELPDDLHDNPYPYFLCQSNRTEDLIFCELAKGLGYEIWVDSSVEAEHIKQLPIAGETFRENHGIDASVEVWEVDYE
jgi:hypothetical protein